MDFLSEDLQAAVDMQSPSAFPILHVLLDVNVQHWTSSGSSGQKPGVDLLPEDLQDPVEMHSPGAFPTLQVFGDDAGGSGSDGAGGSGSDGAGESGSDGAGGSGSDEAGGSGSDEAGGSGSDGAGGSESVQHCKVIRLRQGDSLMEQNLLGCHQDRWDNDPEWISSQKMSMNWWKCIPHLHSRPYKCLLMVLVDRDLMELLNQNLMGLVDRDLMGLVSRDLMGLVDRNPCSTVGSSD